jgi:kumamolisin
LTLVFPLVADDRGLAAFATAVTTPGSPTYGDFASIPALARRFGARSTTTAAVVRYLRSRGAASVRLSPTGMFVQATMTVAQVKRTFGTTLSVLRASDGTHFLAPAARAAGAATRVSLPPGLRGLATGVIGLDTEPLAASRHAASASPSAYEPRTGTAAGCSAGLGSGGFTPNQYLAAYGDDTLQQAGLRGRGERVALIEIDGFKQSDISAFDTCFGIHTPTIRTYTVGFRGALAPGGESTLDLELLTAVAPQLSSLDVYENRGDASQVLQAFTAPLIAPGAKPEILSASLGICESFMYLSTGPSGIRAIERDIELASATGITVLASAGDSGSTACENSDGSIDPHADVSYPASSPYVTGVGGTNLVLDTSNHITDEQVWNDTWMKASAGGGGFSGFFHRPSYQRAVIGGTQRVVPDVALLADLEPGYSIFCTAAADQCSGWMAVGVTSAAAPLLAGGFALIDQDLHAHHRRTLGFANPLLYQLAGTGDGPSIFRDVTKGDNDIGPYLPKGQPAGCCTAGPGFDAASGLGSVNVAALDRAALVALPPAPDLRLTIPGHQHPLSAHAVLARLSCSSACKAYIAGDVILSATSGFAIRSPTHRYSRAGSRVLRLGLSGREVGRIRSALASHHHVYAEVYGAALDAHGQALTVTPGAVIDL